MDAYRFHSINFDIPVRFVREMFRLGASRIAILSHAGASPAAKSPFLRIKGELELALRRLQAEPFENVSGITLFKVPLLLTNMKDQNGLKGVDIAKKHQIAQTAALKFSFGPSRAVHVRDLAKAMVADALEKLDVQPAAEFDTLLEFSVSPMSELDGRGVVALAREVRGLQREEAFAFREEMAMRDKVSSFARQEGAFGHLDNDSVTSSPPSSVATDEIQQTVLSNEDHEYAQREYVDDNYSNGQYNASPYGPEGGSARYGVSHESFLSGSQPAQDFDEDSVYSHSPRNDVHVYGMQRGDLTPPTPSGPIENARVYDIEEEMSHPADQYDDRIVPATGTVESLGHQLKHSLTLVRGNTYLPDVEEIESLGSSIRPPPSRHASQNKSRAWVRSLERSNSSSSSRRMSASKQIGGRHRQTSVPRSFQSDTNPALSSPPNSTAQAMSNSSVLESVGSHPQTSQSGGRGRSGESSELKLESYSRSYSSRSPQSSSTGTHDQRRRVGSPHTLKSSSSGGERAVKKGQNVMSVVSQWAAFAGKVISATERPSTRRMREEAFDSGRSGPGRREKSILNNGGYENRDMRAYGKTSI